MKYTHVYTFILYICIYYHFCYRCIHLQKYLSSNLRHKPCRSSDLSTLLETSTSSPHPHLLHRFLRLTSEKTSASPRLPRKLLSLIFFPNWISWSHYDTLGGQNLEFPEPLVDQLVPLVVIHWVVDQWIIPAMIHWKSAESLCFCSPSPGLLSTTCWHCFGASFRQGEHIMCFQSKGHILPIRSRCSRIGTSSTWENERSRWHPGSAQSEKPHNSTLQQLDRHKDRNGSCCAIEVLLSSLINLNESSFNSNLEFPKFPS